jgi:CBS domain-containing protein
MRTVKQLLDEKGHDIQSIHPDDSVFDAIQKLANANIGSLIVVEDDRPVGIFTERDYARNVILKGKSSPTTKVRDIMTTRVIFVQPEQTVEHCMAIMTDKHIRHLPVLRDEKLIGMISIGDLVKSIIADQKHTIEQLEQFIHG